MHGTAAYPPPARFRRVGYVPRPEFWLRTGFHGATLRLPCFRAAESHSRFQRRNGMRVTTLGYRDVPIEHDSCAITKSPSEARAAISNVGTMREGGASHAYSRSCGSTTVGPIGFPGKLVFAIGRHAVRDESAASRQDTLKPQAGAYSRNVPVLPVSNGHLPESPLQS